MMITLKQTADPGIHVAESDATKGCKWMSAAAHLL